MFGISGGVPHFSVNKRPSSSHLEGLLEGRRYGKKEAAKVLGLLKTYRQEDLVTAIERATRYRAFSYSAIERILAAQATPRPPLEVMQDEYREHLRAVFDTEPVPPRETAEYDDVPVVV